MNSFVFALLLFATDPPPIEISRFDWFEVNTKLAADGRPQFTQVILWRWHPLRRDFHAHGYLMVKKDGRNVPVFDHRTELWVIRRSGKLIVAKTSTVSVSYIDPEVEDKKLFPAADRRGVE